VTIRDLKELAIFTTALVVWTLGFYLAMAAY